MVRKPEVSQRVGEQASLADFLLGFLFPLRRVGSGASEADLKALK